MTLDPDGFGEAELSFYQKDCSQPLNPIRRILGSGRILFLIFVNSLLQCYFHGLPEHHVSVLIRLNKHSQESTRRNMQIQKPTWIFKCLHLLVLTQQRISSFR